MQEPREKEADAAQAEINRRAAEEEIKAEKARILEAEAKVERRRRQEFNKFQALETRVTVEKGKGREGGGREGGEGDEGSPGAKGTRETVGKGKCREGGEGDEISKGAEGSRREGTGLQ